MFKYNPKNKYGNKKLEIDGLKFDSKAEYKRWKELELLQKAGEISGLDRQVSFVLIDSFIDKAGVKERGIKYLADFFYYDKKKANWIIEDKKSAITRKDTTYIIKRKLVKHFYPDYIFIES